MRFNKIVVVIVSFILMNSALAIEVQDSANNIVLNFQKVENIGSGYLPRMTAAGTGSTDLAAIKMPILHNGTISLYNGLIVNSTETWQWYNAITENSVGTSTFYIHFNGITYRLNNAYPTKITGTDLKNDGNTIAISQMVIAYGTLEVMSDQ